MIPSHWIFGGLFAALPLVGFGAFGARRGPAFTMYSSVVEFRLEIHAHARATHGRVTISPTSLARDLPPSARAFVAGADHFRRTTDVAPLHRHLDDLARLACAKQPMLSDVEAILFEREGGTTERTVASVECAP